MADRSQQTPSSGDVGPGGRGEAASSADARGESGGSEASAAPLPAPPQAQPLAPLGDARSLDPRFITTERIGSWIFAAIVLGGGLIALALDLIFSWWAWPVRGAVWIGFALLAAVLVWSATAWPRISHRAVSYRFGMAGIEVRRGVLWRSIINVPASRIQHTDVTQGPLLRRYGLATLTMHTAATKTPSVTLSGLTHSDALAVREALIQAKGDDGV